MCVTVDDMRSPGPDEVPGFVVSLARVHTKSPKKCKCDCRGNSEARGLHKSVLICAENCTLGARNHMTKRRARSYRPVSQRDASEPCGFSTGCDKTPPGQLSAPWRLFPQVKSSPPPACASVAEDLVVPMEPCVLEQGNKIHRSR